MEKWKREFIRYLFHYSARRQIIEAAYTVKPPHIPSALYKYRSFNEKHKDALSKGVLCRASLDRMNDPYDAAVYFDQNRMLVEDQTPEEFLDFMESMKRALAAGILWIPRPISSPFSSGHGPRTGGNVTNVPPPVGALVHRRHQGSSSEDQRDHDAIVAWCLKKEASCLVAAAD